MEYRIVQPDCGFYLEYKLDQPLLDWLWSRIDVARESVKNELAGNITESLALQDEDGKFNSFLQHHIIPHYIKIDKFHDGTTPNQFYLKRLWCNFQNKHEFNPCHRHVGRWSFVIWMKIPTDWREQHTVFEGVNEPRASDFEFTYTNMLGEVKHHVYQLDSSMEGTMLFFPAGLYHQVYPFYNCDAERVSISGNIGEINIIPQLKDHGRT